MKGDELLVELLIVVGIVIALAAILLPALHRVYKAAERTRMAADIQVIGEALDAYRNDFGQYPQTGPSPYQPHPIVPNTADIARELFGPQVLCAALIAPGPKEEDGADGPGFRLRGTTGRVYGPYLPADRFVIGTMGKGDDVASVVPFPDNGASGVSNWFYVLSDRRGHVILYYPRHGGKASPGAFTYVTGYAPMHIDRKDSRVFPEIPPGWAVDQSAHFQPNVMPTWNVYDGPCDPIVLSGMLLRSMLGANAAGAATSEATATDAPYLLISAGTADAVGRWYPAHASSAGQKYPGAPHGMQNPFGSDENVANVPLLPADPNLTPDEEDRTFLHGTH